VLRVPVVLELAFARGAAENRCTLQLEKPDKKPTWLGIKVGAQKTGHRFCMRLYKGFFFLAQSHQTVYL
jgi:hypothetical protein